MYPSAGPYRAPVRSSTRRPRTVRATPIRSSTTASATPYSRWSSTLSWKRTRSSSVCPRRRYPWWTNGSPCSCSSRRNRRMDQAQRAIFSRVTYCVSTTAAERPEEPEASDACSTSNTSRTPRSTSWEKQLAPMAPPPMTTTSARIADRQHAARTGRWSRAHEPHGLTSLRLGWPPDARRAHDISSPRCRGSAPGSAVPPLDRR